MNVVSYPDGSRAGTAFVPRAPGGSDEESWYRALSREEKDAENRRRGALSRSQALRRKIRAGNLTRLLTFTNGGTDGGWDTLSDGLRSFWRWALKEGGHELLGSGAIVAVAERGKYGRVHVHAAIAGGSWLSYNDIHASWSAHLENEGHHSANYSHRFHAGDEHGKHTGGFSSARRCASYLCGYLKKSMASPERKLGEHAYESAGCYIVERRIYGFRTVDVEDALIETFPGCTVLPFFTPSGELAGYWFDTG